MFKQFEVHKKCLLGGAGSSRICFRCQKLGAICNCSKSSLPLNYAGQTIKKPATFDDVLQGGVLDIMDTEAQPGSDLDVESPNCSKNNQHDEFIHVDEFEVDHLPDELRHPATYVWLRNCIPSVVRLLRSDGIKATGRACFIPLKLLDTMICEDIHCPYFYSLGPNHKLYGGIGIITNHHVVTDNQQASITRIEFFYNSEERKFVRYEYGQSLHLSVKRMDYSVFTCYVHSEDLIVMLATFDKRRDYAWQQIPQHIREDMKKYAIVISHPHGTSKKISIGNVTARERIGDGDAESENVQLLRSIYDICEQDYHALMRFDAYYQAVPGIELPRTITWYSTATCPGSSGAPVYMGNTVTHGGMEINQAHTHRGVDNYREMNNCFT